MEVHQMNPSDTDNVALCALNRMMQDLSRPPLRRESFVHGNSYPLGDLHYLKAFLGKWGGICT